MKTIDELKAKHAKEIEALALEQAILETLPKEPKQVGIHRDHASVVYGKQYPKRYSFREAYEIFKLFKPIESQHWQNGCTSCRPEAINATAREEHATLVGTSIAEVKIHAGKGYDSHALSFWTEINGQLLDVKIELSPAWKWLPQTEFRYNTDGNCTKSRVTPGCIGEDSMQMVVSRGVLQHFLLLGGPAKL